MLGSLLRGKMMDMANAMALQYRRVRGRYLRAMMTRGCGEAGTR